MLANWRILSQAERDAAYNNNAAVANSAALIGFATPIRPASMCPMVPSPALPGHTLAPDVTLTQIVAEISVAIDWLAVCRPIASTPECKLCL